MIYMRVESMETSSCLSTLLQVDCNDETGESRGCGYVTMGSLNSAKKALSALDRSVSETDPLLVVD